MNKLLGPKMESPVCLLGLEATSKPFEMHLSASYPLDPSWASGLMFSCSHIKGPLQNKTH